MKIKEYKALLYLMRQRQIEITTLWYEVQISALALLLSVASLRPQERERDLGDEANFRILQPNHWQYLVKSTPYGLSRGKTVTIRSNVRKSQEAYDWYREPTFQWTSFHLWSRPEPLHLAPKIEISPCFIPCIEFLFQAGFLSPSSCFVKVLLYFTGGCEFEFESILLPLLQLLLILDDAMTDIVLPPAQSPSDIEWEYYVSGCRKQ